ncbi:Nn.00g110850.m01.CDS01 [Neocucurbitaria sp. VM-36]
MDLDLIGTQPALFRLYTQLAFIFAMPDSAFQHTITSKIIRGLERVSQSFTWVAGQVVDVNLDLSAPPSYRIRPFKSNPELTVRDYLNDGTIPTFQQMTDAGCPMSTLGEEVWAPCPTLAALNFDPTNPSGSADQLAPVTLVQISFIRGGLVLCVNMQHNTCDMIGQAVVMKWLSKACRREEFTEQEIEIGNLKRKYVVTPFVDGEWKPGPELERQLFTAQPTPVEEPIPAPDTSSPKPLSITKMLMGIFQL